MANRIWVLGPGTPQMNAIETLLRECGELVVYAVSSYGVRVHPGNAYQHHEHTGYALVQLLKGIDPAWSLPDNWMSVTTDDQFATMPLTGWDIITVECAAPRIPPEALGFGGFAGPILACTPVDHHRPGDPGFGRPPEEFLAASSLGQVIARLAQADNLPESWEFGPDTSQWSGWPKDGSESDLEVPTPFWMDFEGQWIVDNDPGGKYIMYNEDSFTRILPSHLVLTAAADYCLDAAYAGKCPGVDPEEFQKFRAKLKENLE